MALDFSRLAELATDHAWDLACPSIGGRRFYDPATAESAAMAAREFESAAILWSGSHPRDSASCLILADSYGNGPTLEEHGLI